MNIKRDEISARKISMNILKDLYIIGAGGLGREVAWLIERINEIEPVWNIKGFIDDDLSIQGQSKKGYPIVGSCDCLMAMEQEVWVVCAVGSARVREKIIERLKENSHIKFATVIDPSVIFSDSVTIGEGSIICSGTILTVDIVIGSHVIINLSCTIGHDDVIGDFTTIHPSVNVSGNVIVGKCVELGTGTQIIQSKNIGDGSIIGAGAVIVQDIPDNCTAVGVPASPIKFFA